MTPNTLLRAGRIAASAAALIIAAGLVPARAEDHDNMDHSKMDHSKMDHGKMDHGKMDAAAQPAAPVQWVDPGKAQAPAALDAAKPEAPKADAGKADEHAGHNMGGMDHGGGKSGGMMGGMGGMMGGMNHGSGGGSHGGGMMAQMMCGFTDHLEGRLAYLKAELKLTDVQASAWNTFTEAWRAAATTANAKCAAAEEPMDHSKPAVLMKLGMMEKHMTDHLEIVRAQKAAIEPLFAALSDEQKKIASDAMTNTMKVGMSMMGGGGMNHGGGHGGGGMNHGGGMGGMQH